MLLRTGGYSALRCSMLNEWSHVWLLQPLKPSTMHRCCGELGLCLTAWVPIMACVMCVISTSIVLTTTFNPVYPLPPLHPPTKHTLADVHSRHERVPCPSETSCTQGDFGAGGQRANAGRRCGVACGVCAAPQCRPCRQGECVTWRDVVGFTETRIFPHYLHAPFTETRIELRAVCTSSSLWRVVWCWEVWSIVCHQIL